MSSRPAQKRRGRPPGSRNLTPEERAAKRAMKRKPGHPPVPPVEFQHAEARAKRLLGPTGTVRFVRRATRFKYTVGQAFVDPTTGQRVYGVIGQGTSWQAALEEAEARLKEHQAASAAEAEKQ